jgi:hypothetical protein
LVHLRYVATDYEAFVQKHYREAPTDLIPLLAGEWVDVRLIHRYPEIAE